MTVPPTPDIPAADLDGPVRLTPELAAAVARTLSASYAGTVALNITDQLALPHAERGIIGRFAADSLRDALEAGLIGPGPDGTLGTLPRTRP